MKKTKHFNISVPELGDVPDITQVSNAISDLEDATAGTLEIMKAEMQGTKITLTSVSRKTKRTGYYEGMSIRFKSPQDIEPNYLKTISVDGLGDQTLSVEYKVNRNEYIDIVYEGNKFTAYPVVVQKTDSVIENSSILVGTAKGVKTAYDKGVEALNKANQAQSSANQAQSTADGKVSKSGDKMSGSLSIDVADNHIKLLSNGTHKGEFVATEGGIALWNAITKNVVKLSDDGSLFADAKNLTTNKKEITAAINELNSTKFDKTGGTINGKTVVVGDVIIKNNISKYPGLVIVGDGNDDTKGGLYVDKEDSVILKSYTSNNALRLKSDGSAIFEASNLQTGAKDVVGAINENYKNIVLKPYQDIDPQDITKQGIFPFNNVSFNGYSRWGKTISFTRKDGDYSSDDNYMWQLIFDQFGDVSYSYKINDSDGYQGYSQFAFYDKLEGIIGKKTGNFPIKSGANAGDVYYYKSTKEYYECVVDFSGELSIPNSNFRKLTVYENSVSFKTSGGWEVVRYRDKRVEMYRRTEITTGALSQPLDYPPGIIIDTNRSAGFISTSHTGTDGFRASEISLGETYCLARVYHSGSSFEASVDILIKGITK